MKSLFSYPVLHIIEPTFEGGNITWTCPTCGRKVQSNPLKILVKGDLSATHRGSAGGLSLLNVKMEVKDNE